MSEVLISILKKLDTIDKNLDALVSDKKADKGCYNNDDSCDHFGNNMTQKTTHKEAVEACKQTNSFKITGFCPILDCLCVSGYPNKQRAESQICWMWKKSKVFLDDKSEWDCTEPVCGMRVP